MIADEGLSTPAGIASSTPFLAQVASPLTASRGPVHEPRDMVMEAGEESFYMGQHRNKTYSEVAKKVEFFGWLFA